MTTMVGSPDGDRLRRALDLSTRLLAVTAELPRAQSIEAIAAITIDEGARALGAYGGAFWKVDAAAGHAVLLRQTGYAETAIEPFQRVPLDAPDLPLNQVIRAGESLWIGGPEQYEALYPDLSSRMRDARDPRMQSFACVPLVASGSVIGAFTLIFAEPRLHHEEDRTFVLLLARHCALAIEHVEERRHVERAAEQMSRLQAVNSALAMATTPRQVAEAIVNQGLAATGAQRGIVAASAEDADAADILAQRGHSPLGEPPLRVPFSSAFPPSATLRTGDPIFVESAEEYRRLFPEATHDGAASGPKPRPPSEATMANAAFACVPLLDAAGRAIGAVALGFDEPRRFSDDDRAFLLLFVRQSAVALERARLYEAELRARREAEAASRAKDDFLSNLSHELRTPLTAILGWSNILRSRRMDPAALDRALSIIERNARAQVQLVEDILDISRIVANRVRLEPRLIDPADPVRAALDAIRPTADERGVAVTATIAPDAGAVRADPDRIQQIAWNLLSNAVKFTKKGGRVEVGLDRVDPARLRLRVMDTGQGIAAEFLPHIFDRFRQADGSATRPHGGLGIGLAIVKHLVELHGGTITAESEGLGHGATLTVSLPAAPHETAAPASSRASTPQASTRLDGLKLLVVDDDRDTLEVVATVLRDRGADVTAVSSAAEALGVLRRTTVHALISDIGMPHEDGFTLLQKARTIYAEQARDLPALALTAYAGAQDARMAYRAGFRMHLGKPVAPAQLVDAVHRLVTTPPEAR